MSKKTLSITVIVITAITMGIALYMTQLSGLIPLSDKQSAYDTPDKENPKLVALFNRQLSESRNRYTTEVCTGCINGAAQRVHDLFSSIKSISTYTRYGMNANRNHNAIEVKVLFKNGQSASKLYTGIRWNGSTLLGPKLLMKVDFTEGSATRIWSNGVELKGSPDWVINDINTIIESVIHYDIGQNRQLYFPPEKTSADYQKEWERL